MGGPSNGGRAEAFEALRASEELHRATLGNISDAVFMADDEGKFTFVCPNVDVIFGYTPSEVFGLGRLGTVLGADLFDPAELDAKGEIRNVEREVTVKSGAHRTVLIHLKRVAISGGTVLCTCRDITELKEAERQLALARLELAHAGRLALVGELTASIVHEIQQPLTAIAANAEAGSWQVTKLPEGVATELTAILSDIHETAVSAAEIIERLRNLARKRPMAPVSLDLNDLVAGVARLVSADALRRRVKVSMETSPGLPRISADRVSLQHVVLNLVMNAMEAMEPIVGPREVQLQTQLVNGTIHLTVRDTGPGIPLELLPRIFDPFVTSKRDGIGLGLSIARSIIEAHDGRISASNGEVGAQFLIALPVH
jgi:PAS domain S-box-containing protein